MTQPNIVKVGILIPTFNRKAYLAEALYSSCCQTHDKIEIIVIDNGSTDGTAEFMARVSDPRVCYIVNDNNIGMIGSINKGINLFSDEVEWCTILSDDDFLDKDFVSRLLNTAIVSAAKSIIHSHRIFVDQRGNRIADAIVPPRVETAFNYMEMRACQKRETYLTGVMFNRTAFLQIKGYPVFTTGLASDDAFIFALALKDRLFFERDAIAYIRIHGGAESINCADGILKLETLSQFGLYCKRIVEESNILDQDGFRKFEYSFKKYVRALNSVWWVNTVNCALDKNNNYHKMIVKLRLIVDGNRDNFTFRAKFAIACFNLTGIFPERYTSYRTCWRYIVNISRFLSQ